MRRLGSLCMFLSDYCLTEFYSYHGLPYQPHTPQQPSPVIESSERYIAFKDKLAALLAGQETSLAALLYVLLPALYTAAEERDTDAATDREIDEYLSDFTGSAAPASMLRPALDILERKFFRRVSHVAPSLELGCGDGFASQFIFNHRVTVGSDPLLYGLLAAQRMGRHKEFVALDMTRIPYEDETFNTVYLVHTIDHISDRLDALRETFRVLRPGGVIALTDMTAYDRELLPLGPLFAQLGLRHAGDTFNHFLDIVGERRESFLPDYYYDHLAKLGFEHVEVEMFMSPELSRLVYLHMELQFLIGYHLDILRRDDSMRSFYVQQTKRCLSWLIANDEELTRVSGKGLNMFVTARKPGQISEVSETVSDRIVCPNCRVRMSELNCGVCGREYPVVKGFPLLIDFYADHWQRIRTVTHSSSHRVHRLLRGVPLLAPAVRRVRKLLS